MYGMRLPTSSSLSRPSTFGWPFEREGTNLVLIKSLKFVLLVQRFTSTFSHSEKLVVLVKRCATQVLFGDGQVSTVDHCHVVPRTFVLSNGVWMTCEKMNGIGAYCNSNTHQFHSFLPSPLKTRQVDLSGFIYVSVYIP